MPVFDAADAENPPLHMDAWDEDEVVYLRAHVTHLMDVRARGKAILLPEGMTHEELRAMPQAEVERLLTESTDQARIDEQILVDMIDRWSLRRAPSKAQRERGERGDLVPLTREAIAQLPPAVGQFIRAEIDKRRDIVPPQALVAAEVEAEGADFPGATPVAPAGLVPEPHQHPGAADADGGGSHRAHRLERGRA